jgi:hypothetical protein
MLLCATYSDLHTEVDISGDLEGLRALAVALAQPSANEIALDEPPIGLHEPHFAITESRPMESISIEPNDVGDPRIRFRREGTTLVISGSSQELSRIVGGAIGDVAAGPGTKSGVGSHVHLDPTSDPERRYATCTPPDTHQGVSTTAWPRPWKKLLLAFEAESIHPVTPRVGKHQQRIASRRQVRRAPLA